MNKLPSLPATALALTLTACGSNPTEPLDTTGTADTHVLDAGTADTHVLVDTALAEVTAEDTAPIEDIMTEDTTPDEDTTEDTAPDEDTAEDTAPDEDTAEDTAPDEDTAETPGSSIEFNVSTTIPDPSIIAGQTAQFVEITIYGDEGSHVNEVEIHSNGVINAILAYGNLEDGTPLDSIQIFPEDGYQPITSNSTLHTYLLPGSYIFMLDTNRDTTQDTASISIIGIEATNIDGNDIEITNTGLDPVTIHME